MTEVEGEGEEGVEHQRDVPVEVIGSLDPVET